MANFSSLSSKTKYCTGNVMLAGYDMYDVCDVMMKFRPWLENHCDKYAYILHDADMKEDGVTPKTTHIHFVFHLRCKSSPRLYTTLGRIAVALGVSMMAVSIFATSDEIGDIQYLIHKNHPEKFQYDSEQVVRSYDDEEWKALLAADSKKFDEEFLINVIACSYARSDVVRAIGLYYYRLYRGLINDLWGEFHNDDYSKRLKARDFDLKRGDN